MSVVVMLAILWWGLLGFVAVGVNLWFLVKVLGPKGRLVFALLVGVVGGHLLDAYLTVDERCANDFLSAWVAESADFPKGRVNTRPWGEFADYDRLRDVNPYLAQHLRMRYRSRVEAAEREDVQTAGQPSPVPSRVYVADARVYSGEMEREFRARVRLWVARDSHRVAKIEFEDVVLQ